MNNTNSIRFLPCGDSALTIELSQEITEQVNHQVQFLARQLDRKNIRGIRESVPTFCSLTVYFDPLVISSANVACGFHAGDPSTMDKTAKICKIAGVAIGAHPGFADLVGFGRRNMSVSPADAKAMILYQVGALDAFCKANGLKLQHVKPHGALYNMAAKDAALAKAICEGIYEYNPNLILLGLANSQMITCAKEIGLPYAAEVFADRAYEDDGTLVARTKEGAMIHDEDVAVARVIRMIKEGKVTSISGKDIDLKPDSVCVHGDSEKAPLFVQKIRKALEAEGIAIRPLAEVVANRT